MATDVASELVRYLCRAETDVTGADATGVKCPFLVLQSKLETA